MQMKGGVPTVTSRDGFDLCSLTGQMRCFWCEDNITG